MLNCVLVAALAVSLGGAAKDPTKSLASCLLCVINAFSLSFPSFSHGSRESRQVSTWISGDQWSMLLVLGWQ